MDNLIEEKKSDTKEAKILKLDIKNRLLLMNNLLPKEGNILTLSVAKDIRKKVDLSQKEVEDCGIKGMDSGGLTWSKSIDVEVIFSDAEITSLKTKVSELDASSKITMELLSLCLMIKEL